MLLRLHAHQQNPLKDPYIPLNSNAQQILLPLRKFAITLHPDVVLYVLKLWTEQFGCLSDYRQQHYLTATREMRFKTTIGAARLHTQ